MAQTFSLTKGANTSARLRSPFSGAYPWAEASLTKRETQNAQTKQIETIRNATQRNEAK